MLTSLKVSQTRDRLVVKRSGGEPKRVHTDQKGMLDGGKYYYSVMDDGTVAAGCYDGEGNWRSVTAELLNDVFDLKEDQRLWEGSVSMNSRSMLLMQTVFNQWNEQYGIESAWNSMKENEYERELIKQEEED